MAATGRDAPAQSATADREIVISRVISAPRELVFEAFTEVRHLSRWWGPEGFTTTTRAFEFRVGGEWDFVMHGPDGTDYQEWISWTEIAPPERIALLHGESRGDPNAFESVLTFAPDGAATRIEMRTVFPTKELRDEAVEKYHAIEGGQQTLSNLAAYVTEIVRKGGGGLMAGKVFFSVSMSLDGFIAPESLEDLMGQQWMELQQWVFPQRFFRENLKLGEGGEEGRDNDILRETFERTGASVMGKRMFDAGEQAWPEEAPFHTPVFVVTHEKRDPWERPGGTTFHFVNDGIETALDQAREAAGDRDVRIAGGGATILEYVNAGLIDEFSIALSPVLFGSGIRLFEGVDAGRVALEPVRAEPTPAGDPPDLRRPGAVAVSTRARHDAARRPPRPHARSPTSLRAQPPGSQGGLATDCCTAYAEEVSRGSPEPGQDGSDGGLVPTLRLCVILRLGGHRRSRPLDPVRNPRRLLASGPRWISLSESRRTSPANPSPSRPTSDSCTRACWRSSLSAGCGSTTARTRTARSWPTPTSATAPTPSPTPTGRRESSIASA